MILGVITMKNVLEYLEKSAENFPHKVAAEDGAACVSFRELETACRRVGSSLVGRIAMGDPVGVFLEKGVRMLTAFWGTVYAGGFYVPLNPELPAARLEQIQSVLNAKFILTDEKHKETALTLFPSAAVLTVEALKETAIKPEELSFIRSRMIDSDPLYAIFTSGSTGVPKGVVISHRAVLDFIGTFTETFGIGETDIIGNQAPFDFDVSVKDIYSAVKTGATLSIIPKSLFSRPTELLDWLCDHHITTMIWAVSALCLISTFHGLDYRQPHTVRQILFSGEVMPAKHLRTWQEHLPEARFVNLYGPTEITCNCTYHILDPNRDYQQGLPIGRPFSNRQVFLLDEEDQQVTAPGGVGEICVRGTSLALGYYRAPEQTEKAFRQNPLNSSYPERIYRTGDLGRFGEDGELYFCGRKDFQIKHMGHRIELEEIERAVSGLSGVDRCCCVFEEERQKLHGFYTGSLDKKELHKKLRQLLPVYMVPGALHNLPEFPLTKNGKVDRRKLLEGRNQK